jgi:hypothetical protein
MLEHCEYGSAALLFLVVVTAIEVLTFLIVQARLGRSLGRYIVL